MLENKKLIEIIDEIQSKHTQIENINIDEISAKIDKKLFERIEFSVSSYSNIEVVNNQEVSLGDVYLLTPEESLAVMISTPLGSRVIRPSFGSLFYELVDQEVNDIWFLKAKKAILECTYDEKGNLWDDRVDIKKLDIYLHENQVKVEVELW